MLPHDPEQEPANGFWLAWGFLTVLPVPRAKTTAPPQMARALPWFPLVGGALGGLLALEDWLLRPVLSLDVRDALLLITTALVTGMLHLDGFVDCCDGLLGTRTTERRLAILRDSRVGAYGVLGAVLLLLLRFAALQALVPPARAAVLVLAPLLGRWSMVYAVVRYPYARAEGAGTPFRARGGHLLAATVVALALLVPIVVLGGPRTGVLTAGLLIVALLVTLGWTWWASRRLDGGLTGDTYGALNELVEVAVLVLAPALTLLQMHLGR